MAADTLTKSQRDEALKIMNETVAASGGVAQAARVLGLKQQVLAKAVRDGSFGIGSVRAMATALGRAIGGIQPDDAPERSVELDDEFPARPAALEMARQLGRNPIAIAGVAKLRPKHDADPGMKGWLDLVDEAEAALKGRLPSIPSDDSALMNRAEPTPRRRAAK